MRSTLTDRLAKQYTFHNGVAITSTANFDSAFIDIADIPLQKYIHVYSTLDQACLVTVFTYTRSADGLTFVGPSSIAHAPKSVTANTKVALTDADVSALKLPVQFIMIRLSCTVAPTTGSISAHLEGVTN